jgi:hypothetical protein
MTGEAPTYSDGEWVQAHVDTAMGGAFCSPQRKAAGWRCAAPCADAECVPEYVGTAVMGDGLADAVSVAVLALADDWDDFDHDPATCPRYDCGDCTMKNAVYDLRTCVESVTGVRRGGDDQ